MARPTLIESMSERERMLAANMMHRGESWDTVFKYLPIDDTADARRSMTQLHEELENPLSEALYAAYMNLVEVEEIMQVASEKSNEGSPPHMARYKQLAELKIKLVNQIDDLWEKEAERGNKWEPSFDTESTEFRVFKAAVTLFLSLKDEEKDDFDELSPEDQTRFLQILAEGA